jgi:hypothetical protein
MIAPPAIDIAANGQRCLIPNVSAASISGTVTEASKAPEGPPLTSTPQLSHAPSNLAGGGGKPHWGEAGRQSGTVCVA